MMDDTDYTYLAKRFNDKVGSEVGVEAFGPDSNAQFDVCVEEFEEFIEAYYKEDAELVAEEAADVLITVFILMDRMSIDISEAYRQKMLYNLGKSNKRDEDGKVTDDSQMDKPDFSEFTDGSSLR